MIGAEAEFPAGPQFARDQVDRPVVHHPPLGMAGLGPGVGVKQIDHRQRAIGNAVQHLQRVAHVDADIAQLAIADVDQRLRNAIDEGFCPDEAVIGQQVGAEGEMLAATKADLEMQRAVIAEQDRRRNLALLGHGNARQQVIDQRLLAYPQGFALGAAIEPVERGRIAGFVRGHAAAHNRVRRAMQNGPLTGVNGPFGVVSGSGMRAQAASISAPGSRST